MSHLISRRSFSVGLALSLPAALSGKHVIAQTSLHDPNGTAMDLESVFLRVSPHLLRDMLVATPFDDYVPQRWADISDSPYFSSVGGVNVVRSGAEETIIGAYGIYLAPAGARAGQYLGRRAMEGSTTEVVSTEVGGYAAEILVSSGGDLTQVPVGNVMVLGYGTSTNGQSTAAATASEHLSMAHAEILIGHLRQMFEVMR